MKKGTLALVSISLLALVGCDSGGTNTNFSIKGSRSAVAINSMAIIGSPTSFKVRVYRAYLSTNTNCSDPVLLQDYGSSGQEFNMFTGPTLFTGSPAAGTYNCLIMEISDNLKLTVDQTAVNNHPGCQNTTTEYTHDVYRNGDSDDGQWVNISGGSIDATGNRPAPGADRVAVFASTSASHVGVVANGIQVHQNQWMPLSGAMTSPGSITYFWDATNGISNANEGGTDYCVIETVQQGFR